jgi:16S rRNA (adenine1518-N6/adenine1519-N6)-dimethyltransferase
VRARKRFGQHFLEAPWADKVVAAIDPRPTDRFLEIGPGPGVLTTRLAPRVASLTAVELDRDMVARLQPIVPPNVEIVQADILDFDLAPLLALGPFRVAGNLPYNVATPILFKLIDVHKRAFESGSSPLRNATVMVQREVADRIEAQPGTRDYGALSIGIQLHASVRRLLTLPPGAFRPPPKVHSAVLSLAFGPPAVSVRDERLFDAMVRALFSQRRKTIGNALARFAEARDATAKGMLDRAGVDPGRRAETLQLTELARLADTFAEAAL